MAEPRVLVLDLDGTTLTRAGELLPRDVAAVRALQARGVHVTIATGRLFTGTQAIARTLGITGSVAVMNGSELGDVATGATVRASFLEASHRRQIREHLTDCGLSTFVFGSRHIHYGATDEPHVPYLSVWTEQLTRHADVFEAPAWDHDDVVAICALGERHRVEAVRDALAEALPASLRAECFDTGAGARFIALRHTAEDKGTALVHLAAERGFGPADCVAVGDWFNDVPMLRVAGLSFAMAHATDEVRAAATHVLDAHRDGGGAIVEVAARVWGVQV